jgi:hypothetical protein
VLDAGDVLRRVGWIVGISVGLAGMPAVAQVCTTQARMEAATRTGLADAALGLATAVKRGDLGELKRESSQEFSEVFDRVQDALGSASANLAGETLKVTQVYELDASMMKAGGSGELDFSCPLKGTAAETDFSITGLAPGVYGFAMVEAEGGEHPWLLSFLLRQEGGAWKLAAFYFHPRTAAGKDGLWYWTAARSHARNRQPWLGWMDYGEAVDLLRPTAFVSSSELDKLLAEQKAAAPKDLANGIGVENPLVVKAADGTAFRFTSMVNGTARDGASLQLILHYAAAPLADAEGNRVRNEAAVKAMIGAHTELRQGYSGVIVFADSGGQNPSVLSLPMADVP